MPKQNEFNQEIDELLKRYQSKMPKLAYLVKNKSQYETIVKSMEIITSFVKKVSPDAKIEITPGEMDPSAIYYKVLADEVIIENTKDFCAAILNASNIEFYPRNERKLAMSILFNGAYDPAPAYEEIHKNDKK